MGRSRPDSGFSENQTRIAHFFARLEGTSCTLSFWSRSVAVRVRCASKHAYGGSFGNVSTKPYFRYSLAATAWIVGLPALVLFVALVLVSPPPSAPVSAGIGGAAFLSASAIGAWRWSRFHASARLTFQELMIWAWAKRSWAERSLARGASLLGLDERGFLSPTAGSTLSASRRLRVLRRLNGSLERKDPYTHGHSSRVETYCAEVGADLGLDPDQIIELRRAAALHDVGKMRVPDRILRKAGPLSPDERAIAEEHVVLGARLVARVGTADVVSAVLHHHERWDGRGYPHGLAGERIPIYARIIAVVDAYDAMTSTRPYRRSITSVRALEILQEEAGRQFDTEVVKAFVRITEGRSSFAVFAPFAIGLRRVAREIRRWIRQPATAGTVPAVGGMTVATLAATAILSVGPVSPVRSESDHPSGTPASAVALEASPATKTAAKPSNKDERGAQRPEGAPQRGGAPTPGRVDGDDAGGGAPAGPVDPAPDDPVQADDPDDPVDPPDDDVDPPDDDVDPPDDDVDPPDDDVDPPDDDVDPPDDDDGDPPDDDDGGGAKPKGDPQPDKGRDCDNPGNPDSEGRKKHCG
jgi:putative nucleotidyltransferase with HDIG domain